VSEGGASKGGTGNSGTGKAGAGKGRSTSAETGGLDREARARLEQERDFLMKSLDDLELEHENGGIDDESYASLHDDYTARTAAVIRTLRDGVDTRPAPPPRSARTARTRVAVVALIVVFALVAGVSLAYALGARLPGQTASGNSQASSSSSASAKIGSTITRLQKSVNASPDDYELRLQLADAYASNNDLPTAIKQWDAAITISPTRPEAQALIGRALYIVSESLPEQTAQQQAVAEAVAAEDKAIQDDPTYADSYFYRGVIRSGIQQLPGAQADLQNYLLKAPNGQWAQNATSLLAQVTTALESPSTTVPPTTTQPKSKKK
jgi:cytochrome c-type biogenesis protein CcmH/NrfG